MRLILVVDDSAIAREIVVRALGEGFEYAKADSGEAALRLAAERRPDLVVLDLLMPGLDGFETLARLRELPAPPPVLLVSADIQRSTRRRALAAGAVELVNKPVDAARLRALVDSTLAGGDA